MTHQVRRWGNGGSRATSGHLGARAAAGGAGCTRAAHMCDMLKLAQVAQPEESLPKYRAERNLTARGKDWLGRAEAGA